MNSATSPSVHRQRVRRLLLPAALALLLTGVAVASALTTWRKPFPSLLVDAYLRYSLVELPSWRAEGRPRLCMHHRLVAVDGEPLQARRPLQALQPPRRHTPGSPEGATVELTFERPAVPNLTELFRLDCPGDPQTRRYTVATQVRSIGAAELLFLVITHLLAAWGMLWFGGLVLVAGGRAAARRAYTLFSAGVFTFLVTFYDYHTQAWLAPLFSVSTLAVPVGALWLAYAFPQPPQRGRVVLRGGLIALSAVAAGAALVLGLAPLMGWDPYPLRYAIDGLAPLGILALPVSVLLRLRHSSRQDRVGLLTALWGLVTAPLLIVATHAFTLLSQSDARQLVMPFLVLVFPLSVGYAMIRNNLLEARLVLTPKMLIAPITLVALFLSTVGAYATWLATRLVSGDAELGLSIALGAALFILLMVLAWRLQMRLFFSASFMFRRTVDGLKDRLASLRDIPAIRQAVEEAVVQALPTASARVLEPGALAEVAHLPPGAREQLVEGGSVWTTEGPREQHVLLPMRSVGEFQAVLLVGPKHGAALYTQEDLHLLDTLAGLGALALHNAQVVQELDSLRRLEVGAAQEEKRLVLSALSTEVVHEMGMPLSFLKSVLRLGQSGRPLEEEDLSCARDEIGRMERMIQSLRRLEQPSPSVDTLQLLGSVQRAHMLLREPIQQKALSFSAEVSPEVQVEAESDKLLQLLSNLLRNAAQAAPQGGAIGVTHRHEAGAQVIEVWNTGPAMAPEVAEALFKRRVTTKKEGYGVGLSVVQRVARDFNWRVSFRREGERTVFSITLPNAHDQPRHE